MLVTKRNGSTVDFDISKVKQVIHWATDGIDGVDPLELESHVDVVFKEGIKTTDIQDNLIQKAASLASLDTPNYKYVAGRLVIMKLWKRLTKQPFHEYVLDQIEAGVYSNELLDFYTLEDLELISKYIVPDRDLRYDYAGANLLENRYLLPNESPQAAYMVIALWIASVEQPKDRIPVAITIYDAISLNQISLATPILGNLRKPNSNLSSCFITMAGDSLESIFDVVTQVAKVSKQGGGIGVNLSNIRAEGASIQGIKGASGGVIPWVKLLNDTATAVNQLGKRAGAVTPSLDVWHYDIPEFLELQTENGDLRKKAYDVFPQVVIPDLFMERVKADKSWILVDPSEVFSVLGIELPKLWGEQFEDAYHYIESQKEKLRMVKTVQAKELFKGIMKVQIETGMPYLAFKDAINRVNPNKHEGYIPAVNLCVESFSNVSIDPVTMMSNESHVCNLVSLNLATLVDDNQVMSMTELAVRILDNAIELTSNPTLPSAKHNNKYRTIGVGVMGLADWLVYKGLNYDVGHQAVSDIFELIQIAAIIQSIKLAEERGRYPAFEGSMWDTGERIELYAYDSKNPDVWLNLQDKINQFGIRNSQLTAIAPNTSSSLVQGCTPSVLPIYSKFYYDSNARGFVPISPPYIHLNPLAYKPYKLMDQKKMNKMIAGIQQWVDTGISYELLFDLNNPKINAKFLYDTLMDAWELGIKTIYYIRTIQKDSSMRTKQECESCAG